MFNAGGGAQRDRRRQMACRILGLPPTTSYTEASRYALAMDRPAQCRHGHDITDPLSVTLYIGPDAKCRAGWRIQYKCRACSREANKRKRELASNPPTHRCQNCGTVLPSKPRKQFCSLTCRRAVLAAVGRKPYVPEMTAAQAAMLLDLQGRLERETRAWLRPEIQARIDALKQPRRTL